VAGFPLLTDNHVRQGIIQALKQSGWDVVRAVDVFGEENDDADLLAWAADNGRALATCDKRIHVIAHQWLKEGRPFRFVNWWQERYRMMTAGEMAEAFEGLARKLNVFAARTPVSGRGPRGSPRRAAWTARLTSASKGMLEAVSCR